MTFIILQLPPGDFVDAYVAQASAMGTAISAAEASALRHAYGLDQSLWVQYFKWLNLVAHGEFGQSFEYGRPVTEVIGDRLWLTILLSLGAIIVTWGLALPIGIYSAVRQYSIGDYVFTFLGFIGLAVPNFLLALIIMYVGLRVFNVSVGGLFSAEYPARALVVGQSLGPAAASAGADADPGAGRHRATGPHHARQPAGRTAPPLRRDRAGARAGGAAGDPEISGAGRA